MLGANCGTARTLACLDLVINNIFSMVFVLDLNFVVLQFIWGSPLHRPVVSVSKSLTTIAGITYIPKALTMLFEPGDWGWLESWKACISLKR